MKCFVEIDTGIFIQILCDCVDLRVGNYNGYTKTI